MLPYHLQYGSTSLTFSWTHHHRSPSNMSHYLHCPIDYFHTYKWEQRILWMGTSGRFFYRTNSWTGGTSCTSLSIYSSWLDFILSVDSYINAVIHDHEFYKSASTSSNSWSASVREVLHSLYPLRAYYATYLLSNTRAKRNSTAVRAWHADALASLIKAR